MSEGIFEINGEYYMITRVASKLWGVKPKTVGEYCKDCKVVGAFKNERKKWRIPIRSVRPLSIQEIKQLLVLSLQLKNNPALEIDWAVFPKGTTGIREAYEQLHDRGYLAAFQERDDRRIPYVVVLTPKGMEIATSYSQKQIKQSFADSLATWSKVIIEIGQLLAAILALKD